MPEIDYHKIAAHIKPAAEQLPDAASVSGLAHATYDLRPQDAITVWQTEDLEEQARIWSEWTNNLTELAGGERPVVRHSLDLATRLGIKTLQALRSNRTDQLISKASGLGLHWGPQGSGQFKLIRKRVVILEAFGRTDNCVDTEPKTEDLSPNQQYL